LFDLVVVADEDILTGSGLAASGDAHETNNPPMRLPANNGQFSEVLVQSYEDPLFGVCRRE